VALISISAAVMVINITMNIRNGQRLSIDDVGWLANGTLVGLLSLSPNAAMAAAGHCWTHQRRIHSALAALIAVPLAAFNLWNVSEFVGDQMLAKHDRVAIDQELANKVNDEILRTRREADERLWKAWRDARDPSEKASIMKQLKELRAETPALRVPIEAPSSVGARSSWLAKRFKWDRGTIDGVTPMLVPIIMQLVELSFSFLGFSMWPRKREATERTGRTLDLAEFKPEFSMDEARQDVLRLIADGVLNKMNLNKAAFAERWHIPTSTAWTWLQKFEAEGLIHCVPGVKRNEKFIRAAAKS